MNPILKDLIEELADGFGSINAYNNKPAIVQEYYDKLSAFIEDVIDVRNPDGVDGICSELIRDAQRARLKGTL